jgi:hypothetical protein
MEGNLIIIDELPILEDAMVGAKTLIKMKAKGSHSLFLGSQKYLTF